MAGAGSSPHLVQPKPSPPLIGDARQFDHSLLARAFQVFEVRLGIVTSLFQQKPIANDVAEVKVRQA